jgi:hypothetical protein
MHTAPAGADGEHGQDRVFLCLRGPLVHEQDGPPVAGQATAVNRDWQRKREPGDVGAVDVVLVEMVWNGRVTGAVIRVFADPAWTQRLQVQTSSSLPASR